MKTFETIVTREKLKDPMVKKFVQEISDQVKISTIQSLLATKEPGKYKLKLTKDTHIANAIFKYKDSLKNVNVNKLLTPELKNKISLQGIDLSSEKYAMDQSPASKQFSAFSPESLSKIFKLIQAMSNETTHQSTTSTTTKKKVIFNLYEVKCVDETNPEPFGSDDIRLFGAKLVENADPVTFDAFKVGNFDDGDKKTYSPVKVLASFDLAGTYPQTIGVSIGLVEKDTSDSLANFIETLYSGLKGEIKDLLTKAGAAITGGLIGAIGGPIGAAIGVVIGLIIDAVSDWLSGIFTPDDDFFPVQAAMITFETATSTFENNSLTSPVNTLTYKAHDGTYNVKYNWQIIPN